MFCRLCTRVPAGRGNVKLWPMQPCVCSQAADVLAVALLLMLQAHDCSTHIERQNSCLRSLRRQMLLSNVSITCA